MAHFTSEPFAHETEYTGHIVVHLNVSVSALPGALTARSEPDLFITVRQLDTESKQIFYTGTIGGPVPVTKGWLRVSLRKSAENHCATHLASQPGILLRGCPPGYPGRSLRGRCGGLAHERGCFPRASISAGGIIR